jgi:hypothetical protein
LWRCAGWESPENNLHGFHRGFASCVAALTAPVIVWIYPPYFGGKSTQ